MRDSGHTVMNSDRQAVRRSPEWILGTAAALRNTTRTVRPVGVWLPRQCCSLAVVFLRLWSERCLFVDVVCRYTMRDGNPSASATNEIAGLEALMTLYFHVKRRCR